KNIPPGAGLGGGSSNAAVTLMAVNDLYDLNLSPSRLEALGAELGADVPFFIRGGTQLGEGIGERLTPLSRPLPGVLVLVLPPVAVNTAWAYSQVKTVWTNPRPQPNFAGVFQDEKFAYTIFENDFERIVIPAYPEIGRIKQGLIQAGAVFASLSGSGSTVYGIFNDEASARKAELTLRPHGRTLLAHPVHRHPDL
ncbi:MAG: 4-(cytidine 5'-diphospho)-2-C-methyl-D-erythritol kinase, partial [Candidatus Neomarinimicrobiota bacterium]